MKLKRCPFCGAPNCAAHKKYTDRCVDCGKRYARYTSYKSQQRKDFSIKRERQLDKIVTEYKDLKLGGYKVPHDIK